VSKKLAEVGKQNKRQVEFDALAVSLEKSYGAGSIARGGLQKALKSIPTGSLALDYELGTGGWPIGYVSTVFGPRDIGKSSMIAYAAIRNAQAMGLNCALVALEPNFDAEWAKLNGVVTEDLLVAYPTTGEEAFAMTLKLIRSEVVDLIVFDSIGAVLSEGEMEEDGKPRQGGQAGLITWYIKAAAPLCYRNDVCLLQINQVRDNMKARMPGALQMPGGHALEHHSSIIVQLKRGSGRYTIKQHGTDVQIGQEIIAYIPRNKMTQGGGKKAVFDYFSMETEEYPFGVDQASDVINTAKRTGVIKQAGSFYTLPNGERFQGQKAVAEYISENPDELGRIRDLVLTAMLTRGEKTVLEAVPEEEAADAS
jgi:recombination protein RecA